jgi:hypothetical protein
MLCWLRHVLWVWLMMIKHLNLQLQGLCQLHG